jgi:hypothetical protein
MHCRVHRENEERKVIIMELDRGGSELVQEVDQSYEHEVRNRETTEHMTKKDSHSQHCSPFTLSGDKDVLKMTARNPQP